MLLLLLLSLLLYLNMSYYTNIKCTLINANLGHSTLIYLALINVACKYS